MHRPIAGEKEDSKKKGFKNTTQRIVARFTNGGEKRAKFRQQAGRQTGRHESRSNQS